MNTGLLNDLISQGSDNGIVYMRKSIFWNQIPNERQRVEQYINDIINDGIEYSDLLLGLQYVTTGYESNILCIELDVKTKNYQWLLSFETVPLKVRNIYDPDEWKRLLPVRIIKSNQ